MATDNSKKGHVPKQTKPTKFELNPNLERYLVDFRQVLDLKQLSEAELDVDRVWGLLEDMLPEELVSFIKKSKGLIKKLQSLGKTLGEYVQQILAMVPQALDLTELLRIADITDIETFIGPILEQFDFREITSGMEGLFGNSINELKGISKLLGITDGNVSRLSNTTLPGLAVQIGRVPYDNSKKYDNNPFMYTKYPPTVNKSLLALSKGNANIGSILNTVKSNASALSSAKMLYDTGLSTKSIKSIHTSNVPISVITSIKNIPQLSNVTLLPILKILTLPNGQGVLNSIIQNSSKINVIRPTISGSDKIGVLGGSAELRSVKKVTVDNSILVDDSLLVTLEKVKEVGITKYKSVVETPLVIDSLISQYGIDRLITIINSIIEIPSDDIDTILSAPESYVKELIDSSINPIDQSFKVETILAVKDSLDALSHSEIEEFILLISKSITINDMYVVVSTLTPTNTTAILNIINELSPSEFAIIYNNYKDLIKLTDADIVEITNIILSEYNIDFLTEIELDGALYKYILKRLLLAYAKVGNIFMISYILKHTTVNVEPLYRRYLVRTALKHYVYTDVEKTIDGELYSGVFCNTLTSIYVNWDVSEKGAVEHRVISVCSDDALVVLSKSKQHYSMFVINKAYSL